MWLNAIDRGQGNSELSEDIMAEALMEAQPKFERFLSFIAVTAAIAPLLGLLGTVTGIIKTFEMMGVFGAGDPKPLIGGISEALITTELGLILAIPALLFHALLSRRAQSLLAKMERASVAMVNGLAHQNTAAAASTQSGSGTTSANATDAKAASSEGSSS
jgi:biopolymer transport protein ExbB